MMNDTVAKLFSSTKVLAPLELDISSFHKGIDNYHVDVKLSPKFSSDLKKLVAQLLSEGAKAKGTTVDNSDYFNSLRDSYLDLMTVLIHRIKTDLKADDIHFLQFAVYKHILFSVQVKLDDFIEKVKIRSAELRSQGSSDSLTSNQRLFWLSKNRDSIQLGINKQIFHQLWRVEVKELKAVRKQYLPALETSYVDILSNPMLMSGNPAAHWFLIDEYALWDLGHDSAGYNRFNESTEALINEQFPDLAGTPLRKTAGLDTVKPEIYDELGGLFKSQPMLGPAEDTDLQIKEEFTFLDAEENIDLLFNIEKWNLQKEAVRKEHGFKAYRDFKKQIKPITTVYDSIVKFLNNEDFLLQLISSYGVKKLKSKLFADIVEAKSLVQFLADKMDTKKLLARLPSGSFLSEDETMKLESARAEIREQFSKKQAHYVLKVLKDMSRYRLNLKYYRFAHRAFNRLSILGKAEDLQLSKEAGTLYYLPGSKEIEDNQTQIAHHSIIKADVRGSTVVTDELEAKGLNPASYFSLRFFSPINKLLNIYGGNKVFIEGDAVILSLLEYENTAQEWFSVARACGLSRAMLNVTFETNRYSKQMGLPPLELGIGICYAAKPPRFLYDDEKPIMISPAIGLADRLSSCSWRLRRSIKPDLINVSVFEIAEEDRDRGEKGQEYVRYNVNGILLDNIAFEKLETEIDLKKLSLKLNGQGVTFYTGSYPDAQNRKRTLLIREGRVGLWKKGEVIDNPGNDKLYFEVVANKKLIARVISE